MTKQLSTVDAEAQFSARKANIEKLQGQCSLIAVTDETTKKIAVQTLSMLKAEMKAIEADHKEIKSPALKLCQAIDKLKNDLYNPAEAVYNAGAKKVLDYDQEERRKALAEQNRILAIKTAIATYSNRAIKEMDACTTMEQLRECRTRLIVNADATLYKEFASDFEATKLTLNEYAKARRTVIETPAQADPDEVIAIKEAVVENNATIGEEAVAEAKVEKMKGVRGTWRFELIDITEVPLEWLCLDEAKIKAFIKEDKDTLVDGDHYNGVRFFIEEKLNIR